MDSEHSNNTACTSDLGTEDEGYEDSSFIAEMSRIAARLNRDSVIEKRVIEPECRWCFRPECVNIADCLGQQAENRALEKEEQAMHMKETKRLSLLGAQSMIAEQEEILSELGSRKDENWHEGEIEPEEAETERERQKEDWVEKGLWNETESRTHVDSNLGKESSDEHESGTDGSPEMVMKRVQWVEEAKEIEMRQLIDNILPTRGKKHKDCVYPCGVSDTDERLPALVDSSSSDDEEDMPTYECEATGYRATERHWKKISAHNRKWERKFKALKTEHENIMHGPVVTGQELAVVIDCFKQSKEAERIRYEHEKARNDDLKEGLKKFERNLDLLLKQAERREGMLTEKDKIIAKLRKEIEKKTTQVSSLRRYLQAKESRISYLEEALEKEWAKNRGIHCSR
jgi:DNA repair exonuclease SbcCD ATPase subunit